MTFKARTAVACRIARVDRQMFNEATMRGQYFCAPKAEPGAGRVFDVKDIAALFIWGALIKDGMSRESAGEWACQFRQGLRSRNHKPFVAYARYTLLNGASHWVGLEAGEEPHTTLSNQPVIKHTTFQVDAIIDHIGKLLEDEKRILGDED